MGFLQRADHTAPGQGRRARRSGARTWLGTADRSRWIRWTVPLVVVVSVVAVSLWAFTRPSGSNAPAGDSVADAGGSPGGTGDLQGTVVSLTFNFGTVSQYVFARPLLRQYGMQGTFYVTTHRLDNEESCCMSWGQAQQLYREGDEIGGSSVDGVDLTVPSSPDPSQDYADKKQKVCGARDRLADLGLDPRSFAYPGGAYRYDFPTVGRSLTDLVASCGYLSGRIVGGLSPNGGQASGSSITLPPSEPYVVRTPDEVSTSPIVLSDLQQAVLAASGPGAHWVPMVFGEVCHQGDPSYVDCMSTRRPIDDAVLAAFLSWLRNAGEPDGAPAGTSVRTVRDVMGAPPAPPFPVPPTFVSLTFDDGDATQELAGQLLRARGLHGTFYINTGPVDDEDPGHMSWSQILRLHRDGNDIGGHTVNHVDLTDPGIPEPVKRDEICQDRRRLQEEGLDPQSFSYPYGALDPAAEDLVESCDYRSGRSGGSVSPDGPIFAETVPPADPYATMALDGPSGPLTEGTGGPGGPLTLPDLQRAVVTAADNGGGWVQVILHRICVSSDPQFATCMSTESPIEESTFTAFLDWLEDGAPDGTAVRTVQQVMSGAD
jgi:peptidoglycan/xylan/chitin deacetylase (PgdA/CDA1 family)